MTSKVIAEIFDTHGGFERDGNRRSSASGVETTLYLAVGNEVLVVDRVTAITLEPELLIATTRKDRYLVAYEDVRAVRFSLDGRNNPGY